MTTDPRALSRRNEEFRRWWIPPSERSSGPRSTSVPMKSSRCRTGGGDVAVVRPIYETRISWRATRKLPNYWRPGGVLAGAAGPCFRRITTRGSRVPEVLWKTWRSERCPGDLLRTVRGGRHSWALVLFAGAPANPYVITTAICSGRNFPHRCASDASYHRQGASAVSLFTKENADLGPSRHDEVIAQRMPAGRTEGRGRVCDDQACTNRNRRLTLEGEARRRATISQRLRRISTLKPGRCPAHKMSVAAPPLSSGPIQMAGYARSALRG